MTTRTGIFKQAILLLFTYFLIGFFRVSCAGSHSAFLESLPVVFEDACCQHCSGQLKAWPVSEEEDQRSFKCDGCHEVKNHVHGCELHRCYACFYTLCLECAKRDSRRGVAGEARQMNGRGGGESPPPSYNEVV